MNKHGLSFLIMLFAMIGWIMILSYGGFKFVALAFLWIACRRIFWWGAEMSGETDERELR